GSRIASWIFLNLLTFPMAQTILSSWNWTSSTVESLRTTRKLPVSGQTWTRRGAAVNLYSQRVLIASDLASARNNRFDLESAARIKLGLPVRSQSTATALSMVAA